MNIHEERLKCKLALWDTPGFFQFIKELDEAVGDLVSITEQVEIQRKLYQKQLDEIEIQPKPKFKQSKLPL